VCLGGRLGCLWKTEMCVEDCGFILEMEDRVVYWRKIVVRTEKDHGKWWRKIVESGG
jgi:hypothetical protein